MEKDFKELVITNAKKIFIRYGYNKTTMSDIAKECHKSKGLIYHHYSSKEEIFRIIVTREFDKTVSKLIDNISQEDDCRQQLTSFVEVCWGYFINETKLYYRVVTELNEYFHLIEDIIKGFIGQLITLLGNILQNGIRQGIYEIKDIKSYTVTLLNLILASNNMFVQNDITLKTEMQPNINEFVDIILNGIVKR